MPLASYGKNYYTEYTNAINMLKSNIESLNNSTKIMIDKADERVVKLEGILKDIDAKLMELKNESQRVQVPVDREKILCKIEEMLCLVENNKKDAI